MTENKIVRHTMMYLFLTRKKNVFWLLLLRWFFFSGIPTSVLIFARFSAFPHSYICALVRLKPQTHDEAQRNYVLHLNTSNKTKHEMVKEQKRNKKSGKKTINKTCVKCRNGNLGRAPIDINRLTACARKYTHTHTH